MPILYGVSPIGLGHASRAAAIGSKLRESGLDFEFATSGKAVPFLRSYGFKVHDVITSPVPSERNGVMRYPSLWYIRYWRGYRSSRTRVAELMEQLNPELVVGDEEFSSVSLALERGISDALITDELELGFASGMLSRYIERRVSDWYSQLQRRVSLLLVPDYGTDHENVHFVTPVVRDPTRTRAEVLHDVGIDDRDGSKVVLLSASGSGIGEFLLKSVVSALDSIRGSGDDMKQKVKLIVTGLPARESTSTVTYLGVYRDNQDLVAASDLVISTAGKSTIDEAMRFGTPMIAIPIKNHFEQERNAASLGFTFEDLARLRDLIPRFLVSRNPPRDYNGADRIAAYLREPSR